VSPEEAIATREALAKLRLFEGDTQCAVCGSADWESYEHDVIVLPLKGHGVVLNGGIPCVALFCRVCGNARFHARKMLENGA
jgi:hypothetical protein